MTDETKRILADMNGLSKEYYEDKVKKDVRKVMSADDELAILRKAVAKLFELVSVLHNDVINNAEFAEYNELIESIKKKNEVLKS